MTYSAVNIHKATLAIKDRMQIYEPSSWPISELPEIGDGKQERKKEKDDIKKMTCM